MIDGRWTARSQGMLAGEPKTSKSMVALMLAVAVASGEPFLGEYRVKTQGSVVFVDNETGEHTTQDRLRRIERKMGLIKEDEPYINPETGHIDLYFEDRSLPISLLRKPQLDLTDDDHVEQLIVSKGLFS